MPESQAPPAPSDGDRLRHLVEAGRLLSSLPTAEALDEIARRTVPAFADWVAFDVVEPSGALRSVTAGDEAARPGPALGGRSMIVGPMAGRTRVFGTITLVFGGSRRAIEEGDLAFAADIALRAAAALEVDELRATEQAARSKAEEEADRVLTLGATLDRTLGIVGHDLRGPLGAIVMSAEVLRRRGLSTGDDRALLRIAASAARMASMINQLLDFSVLRQTGDLRLNRRRANVGAIARDIVDEVQALSPDASIQIAIEGDAECECDADRIGDAVANLVRNAIQHGEGRRAEVRVRGEGDRIEVSVASRGRPIPPELQAVIFEPFRQGGAKNDRTRSIGLGLYIVKSVMEAHGGGARVQSDAEATTFTIWLPRGG